MSSVWLQWLMVAAGGAAGGALRYGVSVWFARRVGETLPWGTLIVNTSGAWLLGLLMGWLATGSTLAGDLWLLLGVGAIGSYTTVSSLSLQALMLWQEQRRWQAAAYLALSLLTGLAAGAFGLWMGRL